MTLNELFSDTEFRKATRAFNDYTLTRVAIKGKAFCYYRQHLFDNTLTKFAISSHKKNENTIYDYTTLTQDEINNLVDAKIKYDFQVIHFNTFSDFYSKIISETNDHITKYNLSQVTPDLLHEIIHKNEVFIANLNSLYASNKILAELDAL
jgi:hypothetical protein